MKVVGIIPARYASSRFPGKPLVDIEGKSMIQRVYEQVQKCERISAAVIATDDERIFNAVKAFGGTVVMTADTHTSGTDRCAEALGLLEEEFDIAVNIQGDEPFIDPIQIEQVIGCFENEKTDISTLIKKIDNGDVLCDSNTVKVVTGVDGAALYFSRTCIPYLRDKEGDWLLHHDYYQHIGIYGFRTKVLKEVTRLKPSALELAESLEQLRWLENGYKIVTAVTDKHSVGIDTPEDLERL